MIDKQAVKTLYFITRSYAATAEMLGISRQRVHAIVENYKNTGRKGRQELYNKAWKDICEGCNKNPSSHLHHRDHNNENDEVENLISLCTKCHRLLHPRTPYKMDYYRISQAMWTMKVRSHWPIEEIAEIFKVTSKIVETILEDVAAREKRSLENYHYKMSLGI